MADIKKELNDIKNAVYGKEVRSSIHDGIKKINEESEESKAKADEAHDVMESIINEGFDNAALEANFEQRLNDEIENLQPEWTSFKNDVTSQLAKSVEYTDSSFSNLSTRKKGKRPLVTFVADDAPKEDLTILKPIAEEMGVPFGIGVVTSWVGNPNFMSWEEIKEMERVGCEIMSHSHTHRNLTTLSESELDEEVKTGLTLLRKNSFNPTCFIYPFNAFNSDTIKVVRRYFDFAFAKTYGSTQGKNYPTINNQAIDRVALGSYFDNTRPSEFSQYEPDTLEYYKARVDECLDKGNLLVFVIHSNATNETQAQYIRDVINYVRTKGIDIVSPSEALAIYGNIIDVRSKSKFIVDADGNYVGESLSVVVKELNKYSASSKPSDYPLNSITTFPINTSGAIGFPENRAGVVSTYIVGNQFGYAKQEYRPYLNVGLWMRTAKNDDTWGNWERVYREVNFSGSPNQHIRNFPSGETIQFFDNSSADEHNLPSAGVVKNVRPGDDYFAYQVLQSYRSPAEYYRYWYQPNGEWGEWVER